MPVSIGEKLGPYEILTPLGAGGMGEVYKARDTRLDRLVAVKVLPGHIAQREDLRQRFEREARAVASLNHPHICVLHDIGSQNGIGYMVMEHIEGETLAARLERGALPLDQALKLAKQIGDALDRAHRAGVTHRDVKPSNIMLTRDGAKVLDFGLAKTSEKPGPTEATLTKVLTTEGTVIGTPQYMAPEQFEGKEADARSDIWAFGGVLYEMVTGEKAFQGKSYSSLVGAILSADPRPMSVQPFTPPGLERLVRRCLAKDPEDRYQSMRDVVLDLELPPQEPRSRAARNRWPWAVAAACLVVTALSLGWGIWMRQRTEPVLPVVLEVNPPEESVLTSVLSIGGSAISPDGRILAFVATPAKGEPLLYVRLLDTTVARGLAGTEGAARPFWSPDSKSLAFVARGKLKRIDLAGGPPVALCDARFGRGGAWNDDGVILFGDQFSGLHTISASGGIPSPVTHLNKEARETAHYYPQFLPGGKRFLYLVRSDDAEKRGIYLGTLDAKPGAVATPILRTAFKAVYDAKSGRLLHVRAPGTLVAQRLDFDPPNVVGDAATIAEALRTSGPIGYADYSVSDTGALFYGQGESVKALLGWRDRSGKLLETIGQPLDPSRPFCLSPDGSRVAYGVATGSGASSEIWVMDLARGTNARVTFSGNNNATVPRWSPDGKQLYYWTLAGLHRKAADGSGEAELLVASPNDFPHNVSPDGKYLAYGNGDIIMLALTGDRKSEPYLQDPKVSEMTGVFSPDGRWVAYSSDESGRHEVYVQGFPDRRGKWMVSADGGRLPEWRSDGKELYWVGADGTVMAASVDLQPGAARFARPQSLFQLRVDALPTFQPARDGQRFLVYEPARVQQQRPMTLQLNWAARLGK